MNNTKNLKDNQFEIKNESDNKENIQYQLNNYQKQNNELYKELLRNKMETKKQIEIIN